MKWFKRGFSSITCGIEEFSKQNLDFELMWLQTKQD